MTWKQRYRVAGYLRSSLWIVAVAAVVLEQIFGAVVRVIDEPLFLLHGGAAAVDDKTLRDCVIFGSERTMEQDPLFALRILVDIAIKALSASFFTRPTGMTLFISPSPRFACTARRASRSRGGCAR